MGLAWHALADGERSNESLSFLARLACPNIVYRINTLGCMDVWCGLKIRQQSVVWLDWKETYQEFPTILLPLSSANR